MQKLPLNGFFIRVFGSVLIRDFPPPAPPPPAPPPPLILINTQTFTLKRYYAAGVRSALESVRLRSETESVIVRYSSFPACRDPGATSYRARERIGAREGGRTGGNRKKTRKRQACVTDYSTHLLNSHKHTVYANQRK